MNTAAHSISEDYEDLYENAPYGYLSLRPDGHIVKANATLARWLGLSAEEILNRRFVDLLDTEDQAFFETDFVPRLRSQGFFNEAAFELLTREEERLPVLVNATERHDQAQKHLFTRVTVFNATDRRRYDQELQNAKAEADAAQKQLHDLNILMQASLLDEQATSALREQFIAVLGHDLRNPLASIIGGVDLLRRTPLNEKAQKIVFMVEASAMRMAELIENVMDFARGRLGGGLTLNRDSDEPLEPMLRHVIAELQIGAPDRVIESHFAIDADIDCDRNRIGQLASNLLANAITHGASNRPIRVVARTSEDCFELSIANSGKAISAKAMKSIFQPFSRGSIRPSQQGLGLGLYIAHSIAVAHGGTLDVTSAPMETRFTFRMPLS